MVAELILIAAIGGIFIIIVRRLPDALREAKSAPPRPRSNGPSLLARLQGIWKSSAPARPVRAPAPAPAELPEPRVSGPTADDLLAEGDGYLQAGKFREAERAFLRAASKQPKNPKLYNRLGAIYLKQQNYTDALSAFEAARDLDASRASRHYNVALAAWYAGKRPAAKQAIARALELDQSSPKYTELRRQIDEG
ncbi:tetratricopeptide repeat protein [Candidatus Berkelbacteria bacterium]|nr:tetratricopeptide repeat protein [Candidatus Berkelbacteria bacterium]